MPERRGRVIVCETGPLISLEKLSDGYGFIRVLYDKLVVPETVLEELVQGQPDGATRYLERYGIIDLLDFRAIPKEVFIPESMQLDRGERDAIWLAQAERLPLLIEEEAGRKTARDLGIPVSGIAGQILKAVKLGLHAKSDGVDRIQELRRKGRVNTMVYDAILEAIQSAG